MHPEQTEFFEKLYRTHFDKLLLYAQARLGDHGRAEEVVQDTFHEALNHIDLLMNHPAPRGWLLATLRNKISNSERIRRRYLHRFLSLENELPYEPAGPDSTAEAAVEELEPEERAEAKIQKMLTKDELYLLKRITLEGATHLEVARELGISVWACQKRLERIRDELDEEFPGHRKKK